jgi:5'-nucleotidase
VNIPNLSLKEISGVQISRQGVEMLSDTIEKRMDPRHRTYYWQGRDMQSFGDNPEIDGAALTRNFISITPVKCDMTDYGMLAPLKNWKLAKPNGAGG